MPDTIHDKVLAAAECEQRSLTLMARAEGLFNRAQHSAAAMRDEEDSTVRAAMAVDAIEAWAACESVINQVIISLRQTVRANSRADAARAAGAETALLRTQRAEELTNKLKAETAKNTEIERKARAAKRKKTARLTEAKKLLEIRKRDLALVKPIEPVTEGAITVLGPYGISNRTSWRIVVIRNGNKKQVNFPTRAEAEQAKAKLLSS